MKNTTIEPHYLLKYAENTRKLACDTVRAAMNTGGCEQATVIRAAEQLSKAADNAERRAKARASEPSVATLPSNATGGEVNKARRRQAVRRGTETYLPAWSDMAMGLPTAFLRSALFSTSAHVQANSSNVLDGDLRTLISDLEIGTFQNLTLTLSGYELCQFDRKVYATCLDYYRNMPLEPEESQLSINTSFYEFTKRMNQSYGLTSHVAIRASLLRLSFAQLRLRYKGWNIEVPKLLTVSFKDGLIGGEFKASDLIQLRITESVATLFGPGEWTAVDKEAVIYDGLKGWLASFYAGHCAPHWLTVESLQHISGYSSHIGNFRKSLCNALDRLKEEQTPLCSRVSEYKFTEDGACIMVIRTAWRKIAE